MYLWSINMKMKSLTLLIILMACSAKLCFAGTGNSNDGLILFIFLSGVLLVIASILFLADFIRKNGYRILVCMITFAERIVSLFQKLKHNRKDPLELTGSFS